MEETNLLEEFAEKLVEHGKRKANLYDGQDMSDRHSSAFTLALMVEEVGEVASAEIRKRYSLAIEECIDVAHTAFLHWLALLKEVK